MEVKIEQTIKLKFGEVEVILSKEDAEKLYDNLADALGYEDGTKTIFIPYDTTPYIPPQRIYDNSPWRRWNEPYCTITSGYSHIAGEELHTGSITTTASTTEKS